MLCTVLAVFGCIALLVYCCVISNRGKLAATQKTSIALTTRATAMARSAAWTTPATSTCTSPIPTTWYTRANFSRSGSASANAPTTAGANSNACPPPKAVAASRSRPITSGCSTPCSQVAEFEFRCWSLLSSQESPASEGSAASRSPRQRCTLHAQLHDLLDVRHRRDLPWNRLPLVGGGLPAIHEPIQHHAGSVG